MKSSLTSTLRRQEPFRFSYTILDAFRLANAGTIRRATVAVLVAWVPVALFSLIAGFDSFRSFLLDYAAESRLLLVIPLLILAEPNLAGSLKAIGRHFAEQQLITENDMPRFEASLSRLDQANSTVASLIMAGIVILLAVLMMPIVKTISLMYWVYSTPGKPEFSPAGWWYLLVSLPLILFLLLRWLLREYLWGAFLLTVSRLDLQLIASHPDRCGGLNFVETSIRASIPFAFALGTLVAGGVANQVAYLHRPLQSFQYIPLVVIAIVGFVCVCPLCAFADVLLSARRNGIFRYDALAVRMGKQFEEKWLSNAGSSGALEVPDFSATIDLYSVVSNVHAMNALPCGIRSITRLVIASLVPAIPLAFIALPFDVIMRNVIRLFF